MKYHVVVIDKAWHDPYHSNSLTYDVERIEGIFDQFEDAQQLVREWVEYDPDVRIHTRMLSA